MFRSFYASHSFLNLPSTHRVFSFKLYKYPLRAYSSKQLIDNKQFVNSVVTVSRIYGLKKVYGRFMKISLRRYIDVYLPWNAVLVKPSQQATSDTHSDWNSNAMLPDISSELSVTLHKIRRCDTGSSHIHPAQAFPFAKVPRC